MPIALTATRRTQLGRRAKHTLDQGLIPAVVYGHGVPSVSIQIGQADFRKVYREAGTSSLIDLSIDGGTSAKTVVKEVQVNPITLEPAHVDFHQIRMDEMMKAEVPLVFVGESKAVKEFAGTLVKSMDSVEVECLPADLPHAIEVDLSALATFDDLINVSSLKLPKGVTLTDDPHATIATVTAPMTDEQLKKLEEESGVGDVAAIKTEAEEKKEAEAAKAAEEEAAKKA